MPYKTRRQKTAAAARRIVFAQNALATYRGLSTAEAVSEQSRIKITHQADQLNREQAPVVEDLTKIAVLCGLIVAAVVILKIFWHNLPF